MTATEELQEAVGSRQFKTIYDIGLGDAGEIPELLSVFSPEKIICFEPNPHNVFDLPANVELHRLAVSDKDDVAQFYAGKGITTLQGSLFRPMESAQCINKGEFDILDVTTTRLDTFIEQGNPIPDLLWIDAQGGEYDILVGLGKYLDQVSVIHLELYLEPGEYENAPLFDVVDDFLKSRFELVRGNPYEGIFSNYIYVRKS